MSTLNEEIARLKIAKANIDRVLIERGASIPENATLDTYYELINSIKGGVSSSEVTATRADVLAGTYTITADSNGEVVEGTIPIKDGQIYYAEKTNQLIPSGQYLSGNLTIHRLESTNFSAENIKNGVTINVNNGESNVFSVKGTYVGENQKVYRNITVNSGYGHIVYINEDGNIANTNTGSDPAVIKALDGILLFDPWGGQVNNALQGYISPQASFTIDSGQCNYESTLSLEQGYDYYSANFYMIQFLTDGEISVVSGPEDPI